MIEASPSWHLVRWWHCQHVFNNVCVEQFDTQTAVLVSNLMMLQQLSGEKHFEGDEHNAEYDHDAFVGREEAKTFDDLTAEESQKRLGLVLATLCIAFIV